MLQVHRMVNRRSQLGLETQPSTDKMAVENTGESHDENEILIKKDAGDSCEVVESSKNKESKLILYHWTQSFSSQKVSDPIIQHYWRRQLKSIRVDAVCCFDCDIHILLKIWHCLDYSPIHKE